MQLIDGKSISAQIKQEIADEVKEIVAAGGKRPHLAAVQARILEGLPCLPPGDLPNPARDQSRISCGSCIAGRFFTREAH